MKNIQIKKILVPVDFSETSEAALTEAITLAQSFKSEITLLHVIEFNGYYFSIVPETKTMLPALDEIEKKVQNKLEQLQKRIKKDFGINPRIHFTTGHIHEEVIDYSEKKKTDLIVMGTHGVSGYKEVFIGSNAQRVVTLSDIPVLTIQQKKKKSGFRNILLPIDNSTHSRQKVNLTMVIANAFAATIHIIGLPDSDEKKELKKFKIKMESVEKIIKSEKIPYTSALVNGKNLAKTAMKFANKNKCDLIVINTGHESKLTGGFLGAFAQQIVNHSKIPVLSIKHIHGEFLIETQGYGIGLG